MTEEKKIDDGGAAFPCIEQSPSLQNQPTVGMSLRDYFAAKAMQSVILDGWRSWQIDATYADLAIGIAADAYTIADAMIAARKAGA
jgi:hypothetical protein